MYTLAELNRMARTAFAAALGNVFEHSAWVADRAWEAKPFATLDQLHAAMMGAVQDADAAARLGLLRSHPELAGHEAGSMTEHSTTEQARLGLDKLAPESFARMTGLNRSYRARFGFPCIIALRAHASLDSVFAAIEERLAGTPAGEERAALEEVGAITRGRLQGLVREN